MITKLNKTQVPEILVTDITNFDIEVNNLITDRLNELEGIKDLFYVDSDYLLNNPTTGYSKGDLVAIYHDDSEKVIVNISFEGGVYEGDSTQTHIKTVVTDNIISAILKAGSITKSDLHTSLQQEINDKAPITHIGSKGVSQHAVVTTTPGDAGFMSATDKVKLDNLSTSTISSIQTKLLASLDPSAQTVGIQTNVSMPTITFAGNKGVKVGAMGSSNPTLVFSMDDISDTIAIAPLQYVCHDWDDFTNYSNNYSLWGITNTGLISGEAEDSKEDDILIRLNSSWSQLASDESWCPFLMSAHDNITYVEDEKLLPEDIQLVNRNPFSLLGRKQIHHDQWPYIFKNIVDNSGATSNAFDILQKQFSLSKNVPIFVAGSYKKREHVTRPYVFTPVLFASHPTDATLLYKLIGWFTSLDHTYLNENDIIFHLVDNQPAYINDNGHWVNISDYTETFTASGGIELKENDFHLSQMPGFTLKGNGTVSAAFPTDLTASQVKTMLGFSTIQNDIDGKVDRVSPTLQVINSDLGLTPDKALSVNSGGSKAVRQSTTPVYINSLSQIAVGTDVDNKFVQFNDAVANLLGSLPEDIYFIQSEDTIGGKYKFTIGTGRCPSISMERDIGGIVEIDLIFDGGGWYTAAVTFGGVVTAVSSNWSTVGLATDHFFWFSNIIKSLKSSLVLGAKTLFTGVEADVEMWASEHAALGKRPTVLVNDRFSIAYLSDLASLQTNMQERLNPKTAIDIEPEVIGSTHRYTLSNMYNRYEFTEPFHSDTPGKAFIFDFSRVGSSLPITILLTTDSVVDFYFESTNHTMRGPYGGFIWDPYSMYEIVFVGGTVTYTKVEPMTGA